MKKARFTEQQIAFALQQAEAGKSWLGEFGQQDKWSFCLTAARMAAEQEKR